MIVFLYKGGHLANLVNEERFERAQEKRPDSIAWWYEASPEQVRLYGGSECWQDAFVR
jgi:hypothetical protein